MKNNIFGIARAIYRRLVWDEKLRFRISTFLYSHLGQRIRQWDRKELEVRPGSAVQEPVFGAIDLPVIARTDEELPSGAIEVAGWVLSKSGIAKVEIYCDEKWVGEAHYGALRPDLTEAYAEFRDAGRSGFYWLLDTSGLAQGRHDLKVVAYCRSGGIVDMHREIHVGDVDTAYQAWIRKNELSEAQHSALLAEMETSAGTMISVIAMNYAGCSDELLTSTLASLQGQVYGNWELQVVCTDMAVVGKLKEFLDAAGDDRVTLIATEQTTWEQVLASCSGRYIGVIEVGDVLEPRALWAVEKNRRMTPDAGLIYADEDVLRQGRRTRPSFKPAWSPIYLRDYNYIGHPWFADAPLLRGCASSGEHCNPMTEHAMLMRLGAVVTKVVHVPMVLCSRNAEVMDAGNKRLVVASGKLEAETCNRQASINLPKVSVVIPTCLRNLEIIEKCFTSLTECTDYPNLEVIIVKNNVANEEEGQRFLRKWPFKVISWQGPFSWSGINNFGATAATGELLLFLNDDVEALNREWLSSMVTIALQYPVGAVGAMLRYPNRTIQHGGVFFVNYGGGARHMFRACNGREPQIANMVGHNRECSAVTGACLLVRRGVFDSVQGFDESLPLIHNDTDFCLRLEQRGLASVVAAAAELIHHEGISRAGMSETEDNRRFEARWQQRLESGDPYSNPNLDDRRDDWWLNPNVMPSLQGRVSQCRQAAQA